MKVTISKSGSNEVIKEFDIPTERIAYGITKLGVFSFIGREVMRVRPPKRNIGVIFNYVTAAAVTEAIMGTANSMFFKKEPEVVQEVKASDAECEPFSKFAADAEEYNKEPKEE